MGAILVSSERILQLKTGLPPVRQALEAFHDVRFRELVREGLESAPDELWLSACSSSGKYHPPFDQVTPGGMINHILVATWCVEEGIRRYPQFTDANCQPLSIWLDRARAAVMLHDVAKNGIPWGKHTVTNHGYLGAVFVGKLKSFNALDIRSKQVILTGIRWHMGRWEEGYERFKKHIGFSDFERLIQEADFYTTRKRIRFAGFTLVNYPLPLGGG